MNMIRRNVATSALTPVNGAEVLAVLEARLTELQQRRDDITKKILLVEKSSAARSRGALDQATALLDGKSFDEAAANLERSELEALHQERAVIDRALEIGRGRHLRLAAERAGEIWSRYFEEIAEVEKQRVLLAIELQQRNRKREQLREKIRAAGGAPFLPTDASELLGIGDRLDEVSDAADRLVTAGIATRGEMKGASRG